VTAPIFPARELSLSDFSKEQLLLQGAEFVYHDHLLVETFLDSFASFFLPYRAHGAWVSPNDEAGGPQDPCPQGGVSLF
jgi:hypothetical protein